MKSLENKYFESVPVGGLPMSAILKYTRAVCLSSVLLALTGCKFDSSRLDNWPNYDVASDFDNNARADGGSDIELDIRDTRVDAMMDAGLDMDVAEDTVDEEVMGDDVIDEDIADDPDVEDTAGDAPEDLGQDPDVADDINIEDIAEDVAGEETGIDVQEDPVDEEPPVCQCQQGEMCCNETCIDPLTDPENCGGCGVVATDRCIGGVPHICATCGDGECGAGNGNDLGETVSCPADCPPAEESCGNGFCDYDNEDRNSCPEDCINPQGAVCGDRNCEIDKFETWSNCPYECGSTTVCGRDGNGDSDLCDPRETCSSCHNDCGECRTNGEEVCEAE